MAPRGRLVVFVISCSLLVAVLVYSLSSRTEVKVSNTAQQMVLENLDVAINEGRGQVLDDNGLESESSDIVKRGAFQMRKIDEYCNKYHHDDQLLTSKDQRELLYRHLLFDDTREALYCFVEKIGCTDMKRLWFLSVGELPLKSAHDDWVDLKYLEKGIRRASLLNKNLTDAERTRKILNYYKIMIVRNPLERLVSGYRNKIEPPLSSLSVKFPNYIKREILQRYQPLEYQEWLDTGGAYNISVQFAHFVLYFIEKNHQDLNPHLKPMINTCHPCTIRYNFYGNFKTFSQDARLIIEKLGLDPQFYRDKSSHRMGADTSTFLHTYYSQLSTMVKRELLKSLKSELQFYYSLYVRERSSHVRLLGIDEDVL